MAHPITRMLAAARFDLHQAGGGDHSPGRGGLGLPVRMFAWRRRTDRLAYALARMPIGLTKSPFMRSIMRRASRNLAARRARPEHISIRTSPAATFWQSDQLRQQRPRPKFGARSALRDRQRWSCQREPARAIAWHRLEVSSRAAHTRSSTRSSERLFLPDTSITGSSPF